MQKPKENQAKLILTWFFGTRLRTLITGMVLGCLIAVIFLLLSLKFTDPELTYNPHRWISKPHEWLVIVGLIIETNIAARFVQGGLNPPQIVVLFCLTHILAAALLYGVVTLLIRQIFLRISAMRRGWRPSR